MTAIGKLSQRGQSSIAEFRANKPSARDRSEYAQNRQYAEPEQAETKKSEPMRQLMLEVVFRSSDLLSLPVAVLGSAPTNSISRGYL